MTEDPNRKEEVLNRPADAATIESLCEAGRLGPAACEAAQGWLRASRPWWDWVSRSLLFVGAALVLSGVVFFFAYNWARMSPVLKFVLIEVGLLACVVAAWLTGLERIVGKVLLLGAGLLVGVLLAVYGQTYQTGADAYELFVGWAVLIAGWVLISRFAAFWLMWLVLVHLGVILYRVQILTHEERWPEILMFLVLGLLDLAAVAAREIGAKRGAAWLAHRWPGWVMLAAALVFLTIPTSLLVLVDEYQHPVTVLAAATWVVAVGAGYWFFRYRARDLLSLTLCALSVFAVVVTWIGKGVFGALEEVWSACLLFGFAVLAVSSGLGYWLLRTWRAMARQPHG